MTIGPAMIVLALLENVQNKVTGFFRTYGRVPMFYYILHFYIIHTIAIIVFFAQGFSTSEIVTQTIPFCLKPPGFGFDWREYTPYGCLFFLCYILYAGNMTGIRAPISGGGLAIYKNAGKEFRQTLVSQVMK